MVIKIIHYVIYCLINIIRIFRLTELYQPTFNPNNITFVRNKSYSRESSERIEIIIVHIDLKTISTYLDIGSQLGYFVYKINELNHDILATGIEMNEISYMYSELLGILNKTKNVAFMNSELTSETAYNMPCYDLVSFLNVFHHIVHFKGFSEADKIMKCLYKKTNKYFIFETGQYNEKGLYWSNDLSFMGNSPTQWVFEYLQMLGFSDVKMVSKFKTHLNSEERGFFICTK